MKIAYQGIPGSNSEAVSVLFAQNQGFIAPEYIPAVHSKGVIDMLRTGQADYGVMATRNLMAGAGQRPELPEPPRHRRPVAERAPLPVHQKRRQQL